MPTIHTLPANPDPDHLRQQARALQRAVRDGDPSAAARARRQHPDGVPDDPAGFGLSTAQLVVAREYGFASWPRLRRYLDLVAEFGWDTTQSHDPDASSAVSSAASPAVSPAVSSAVSPADEVCRLACITFQDTDGPDRWARGRRLLVDHPELTGDHIWAAAAAAEPATVRRLLAEDPARARLGGGPYGWAPLCYLAYSRLDPDIAAGPVVEVAQLFLDAGADPNEGYLWDGRPYPFTLLTGVFGEGEPGPERCPRHPHALAVARLLLDAGAVPNDSQTLYNRQFGPDDDHLELLLEYGLGSGEEYPWRGRLGDLLDSPPTLLRVQLRWAVEHDRRDRVGLLVDHGVDFRTPYHLPGGTSVWHPDDGRTPVEIAALWGHTAIVDLLVSRGAMPPRLDREDELVAAAFRADQADQADRAVLERLRSADPATVERVRTGRPGLIVWAAAQGRAATVALLAELGFDVDARGRGDAPVEGGRDTALHHAAARGDLDLARLLLSLGADPDIVGGYDATPLGWARHFGHRPMIELLGALAGDDHDKARQDGQDGKGATP